MKKIAITLLILLLAVSTLAMAETESKYYSRISSDQEKYNQHLQSVSIPAILSPFVSERATVHIDGETLGIAIENAIITEVVPGAIKDPTIEVWTTSAYADKIIESGNPLMSIASGVEIGEIRIDRIGLYSEVKGFSLYLGMNVLKFFQTPATAPQEAPISEGGPAELPSLSGSRVFYGTNLVYSWGAVATSRSTSQSPLSVIHSSTAPVEVNLIQFDTAWVRFSMSGNGTTVLCSLTDLTPYAEYSIVDDDQTHGTVKSFTEHADGMGRLRFEVALKSDHRVVLTRTPLVYTAAQIATVAVAGTAVATAGSFVIGKAGSSLSGTGAGKFDFLRTFFEKILKLKDVGYEVAEEAMLQVETKALPSISLESIVKLSGIEDAYIGYVVVVLFAASAVEAWVAGRFELLIIVISALLAITGYFGHEMMHKYMAMRYRTRMEFKSSLLGGIVTIISSALGASVAPVALGHLHDEPLDKKQRMLVSVSGTTVNIALAIIFIALGMVLIDLQPYFVTGITLNLAMAVASLLPVGFLEGKRVWEYSKVLCIALLFAAIAMHLFTTTILA